MAQNTLHYNDNPDTPRRYTRGETADPIHLDPSRNCKAIHNGLFGA